MEEAIPLVLILKQSVHNLESCRRYQGFESRSGILSDNLPHDSTSVRSKRQRLFVGSSNIESSNVKRQTSKSHQAETRMKQPLHLTPVSLTDMHISHIGEGVSSNYLRYALCNRTDHQSGRVCRRSTAPMPRREQRIVEPDDLEPDLGQLYMALVGPLRSIECAEERGSSDPGPVAFSRRIAGAISVHSAPG